MICGGIYRAVVQMVIYEMLNSRQTGSRVMRHIPRAQPFSPCIMNHHLRNAWLNAAYTMVTHDVGRVTCLTPSVTPSTASPTTTTPLAS
jgi:hypothetical protein